MLYVKHTLNDRLKFDKATTVKPEWHCGILIMVLSVVYKTQSQGVMMVLSVVCEDSLKDRLKFDKATVAKPEWLCRIFIMVLSVVCKTHS